MTQLTGSPSQPQVSRRGGCTRGLRPGVTSCSSVTPAHAPDPRGPTGRRRRRRAFAVVALLAVIATPVALLPFLAGTRGFNAFVDRRTVAMMSDVALRFDAAHSGVGSQTLPWTTTEELERLTRPPAESLSTTSSNMQRHRLDDGALTQEVITFPSAIRVDHPESDLARAYVYRHGRLGERPIVLWVPGQYVSDWAFVPISRFTRAIVRRGADVVLFVPPYHLERTPRGFDSGDAVLATTLPDHLNTFAQELSDLRRLLSFLRALRPPALGGFGGSAGAMLLLRLSTWDASLQFLTVFIPMIRLAGLLDQPGAAPLRARIERDGFTVEQMRRLYGGLDPTSAITHLSPARISVLYARFDGVADPAAMLSWARAWGVTRVAAYDRGHALALFTPSMYADYARFLDEDLRALGL